MPERVLKFGDLEDIIFVKGAEIRLLQKKIVAIEKEFLDEKFCELYCEQDDCNGCPSNQDCDEARKILQEEIAKINREITALWEEKDFHERELVEKWTESLKKIPNE